jgi:hypothetical protein
MADNLGPNSQARQELEAVVRDTLTGVGTRISNIVRDAIDNSRDADAQVTEVLARDLSRTLKSIIKLSDDYAANFERIRVGAFKVRDIQKEIDKLEGKKAVINRLRDQANLNGIITAELDEQLKKAEEAIENQGILYEQDKLRAKELEKIVGLSGKLASVLGDIPVLNKFINSKQLEEDLFAAAAEANNGGKAFNSWSIVSEHLLTNFKALAGPLILAYIGKQILVADENTTKLAKSLNQTKTEAAGTQMELTAMAMASGNASLNTSKLVEATIKLNQQLGIAKVFSADVTTEFALLTDRMGLAEESAAGLAKMSIMLGKSSHNVTTEALGTAQALEAQAGIQLDNKQVLEEVGKVSGQLLANFQANPAKIAAAVTQAKLLGTTLEQSKKQSESLLDFQTSIQNELQAEIITGQQLNLERARAAALMGDQATVMKELANQNMNFTKFSQMNVIAQKDFAAAIGLSADELSDQLATQQFIGKSRAEVAALAGEEVANRLQALSVQERFNASLQKLQDALTPIFTALAFVLDKTVRLLTLDLKGFVGADDLMSGYGQRTLITPGGAYALNNNDTVIAGTNLFRGNDVYSGPAGALSLGNKDVVDAITNLGNRIDQLSDRPVVARPSEFSTPVTIKQLQNVRRSI